MVYLNPSRPFSRLKMPPRLQFDQPQRTYLALEFHKRRGTRDFLPQLLADFAAQFPGARVPSLNAIRKMHDKFNRLGTINNVNSKTSPGATHSGRRHKLNPGDLPRRLAFCQWLVQLTVTDDQLLQIVTSDEASFHLSTHVNSQ